MSPEAYAGGFEMEPTEDFGCADKFYVLTDRQGLAYFEADQYTRCFGNFWCPNSAIIFKGEHLLYLYFLFFLVSDMLPDLRGRLVGETVIKASLKTKHWQFCTRPPVSASPILSTVTNGRTCIPILTMECPCENWIRQMDGLPDSDDIKLIVCARRAAPTSPVCCHGYHILKVGTFC